MKIVDLWKKHATEAPEKEHLVLFLRDFFIFMDLLPGEIQRFLSITREVHYDEGETIMVEGQEGDTMFVILSGTVEVSKSLTLKTRGAFVEQEKILTRLSAEDHAIFGEVALFEQNTRTASISAVTDCTLLEIGRDAFQRFAEANPSIGYRITRNAAKIICERFRKADQDTIRLTTALSIALCRR